MEFMEMVNHVKMMVLDNGETLESAKTAIEDNINDDGCADYFQGSVLETLTNDDAWELLDEVVTLLANVEEV